MHFYDETESIEPELLKSISLKLNEISELPSVSRFDQRWDIGYLDDATEQPGDFLDYLRDDDFSVAVQLMKEERWALFLNYGMIFYSEGWSVDDLILPVLAIKDLAFGFDPNTKLHHIFRAMFGVATDRISRIAPTVRVDELRQRNSEALAVLKEAVGLFGRPNIQEGVSRPYKRTFTQ